MKDFKTSLLTKVDKNETYGNYKFNFLKDSAYVQYYINTIPRDIEISNDEKNILFQKLEHLFLKFLSSVNEVEYKNSKRIIAKKVVNDFKFLNQKDKNNQIDKDNEYNRLINEIEIDYISVECNVDIENNSVIYEIVTNFEDPKHEYDYNIEVIFDAQKIKIKDIYLQAV